LLEVTVVLAVVALAVGLVLPRLADIDGAALDAAARQLVDAVAFGRERAILSGTPMRLVLDLDGGRWVVGRPAADPSGVTAGDGPPTRAVTLPSRLRVRGVTCSGPATARAGSVALDFAPEGDGLPIRIELADARGRRRSVIIPAGGGRAVFVSGDVR
jgi:Tfp pilus assembly protein FimT